MEAISNKQSDMDVFVTDGYRNAVAEERRRFCFLVDRQCNAAKNSSSFHSKVSKTPGQRSHECSSECSCIGLLSKFIFSFHPAVFLPLVPSFFSFTPEQRASISEDSSLAAGQF